MGEATALEPKRGTLSSPLLVLALPSWPAAILAGAGGSELVPNQLVAGLLPKKGTGDAKLATAGAASMPACVVPLTGTGGEKSIPAAAEGLNDKLMM